MPILTEFSGNGIGVQDLTHSPQFPQIWHLYSLVSANSWSGICSSSVYNPLWAATAYHSFGQQGGLQVYQKCVFSTLKIPRENSKRGWKSFGTCHRFKIFLITLIFSFLKLLLNFLPGEEGNIIIRILQSSFDFLCTWSRCLKISKIQISTPGINVQHKIYWNTAGTMQNMGEHIITFWTECNILRKHYSVCQQQVLDPLIRQSCHHFCQQHCD